jgi:inorganic triphosphatase YgiF
MTLRVRSKSSTHTMTVKRAATAGNPMARPEVEVPVEGPEPDLEAFGPDVASDLARITQGQALRPCFVTDIRRTAHVVPFRHSRIEVSFDTGAIIAGDARESVREIELELLQGDTADLFALAVDLLETVPARLGVLSKAERGVLLAQGKAPRAVRAVSPLAPNHSVDDAIGEVIGACIQQFTGNWPAFDAGGRPDPVHQMRVAMRRLRAALALFQRSFPSVELGAFRADARRIASAMGEARNWDVFGDMVRDGPQTVLQDDDAFGALLEASEAHRRAGYDAVGEVIRSPATTLRRR